MLSACSTFKNPNQAPIPSDLLVPCKAVVVLADGSRALVMKNITANAFNQQECIDRHKALAEAARESGK